MPRQYKLFLLDILEASSRVSEAAAHLDLESLMTDWAVQGVVLWNLQVIGEAVRNVPQEIRELAPEIEWQRITGLRNRIAHEYFGINWEITHNIIHKHLPPLTIGITQLLEKLSESSDNC